MHADDNVAIVANEGGLAAGRVMPDGVAPGLVLREKVPQGHKVALTDIAVGEAVRSWRSDAKVVIIGTGGLSHQLDGQRAGFINKVFDQQFMDSMDADPEWATQYSIYELVEKTGTQGVELLNWLAMRGALGAVPVKTVHRNYHIPISNTATGVMALAA